MASPYGWPVALSLVAFATISTPAVPDARQTRPEHRPQTDFDIRDTHPAAPSRVAPRTSSDNGAPQRLPEVASGVWYVLAHAEDAAAVTETQETNNVRFASVLIGADLMFGFATSPSAAVAGTTITASTTVRNAGAAPAATTIRFYLSTNVSLDASDVALNASQAVPMLSTEGSYASTTAIVLPSDKVGMFYLLMIADTGQVVAETSEGNNLAARLLQLSGR